LQRLRRASGLLRLHTLAAQPRKAHKEIAYHGFCGFFEKISGENDKLLKLTL
jgi:hypothetical protein